MNDMNEVEILIVEDNPNDAEMALRALKKNKISNKVLVIGDGEEALDYIFKRGKFAQKKSQHKPKIILLDLKLPKIDGLDVLKIIKNNAETSVIPVIVLTSSKEEADMIDSYRYGVNSYIIKPVDFEKFVDAVKEIGLYWLILNQQPSS